MRHCLLTALLLCIVSLTTKAQRLPQTALKNLRGMTVQTDTLSNEGRPFIIDFFATWCKPCIRELDAISEVYDGWQEETGVCLYAVSIDEAQNVNKVRPLVENHGWTFEVLLDSNGDLKRALDVQMIPFVMVVDGKGNIVWRHNGYTDGAETELIDTVRRLMDETK